MKAMIRHLVRIALLVLAASVWQIGPAAPPRPSAGASATPDSGYRTTVPFSDPSQPGILHVHIVTGSIVVKASDTKEVVIDARASQSGSDTGLPDTATGMRRLRPQPSFTAEEQDNRVTIEASSNPMQPIEFEIQVPRRTNLQLSTVNRGDIVVQGVDGDLEVGNVNGSIDLSNVSGSVIAHTINGKVSVTMTRVSVQKPMSFTSLNGAVDVTLPSAIKANVKLRSDRGSVYTDFDLTVLPQPAPTVDDMRQQGGPYRIEVNKVIYGNLNGGGQEIELRTFNGNIYLRKGS